MKPDLSRRSESSAPSCSRTSGVAGLRVDLDHQAGNFSLRLKAQFNPKGITAVYGPSASGKSTLLNMIAGFSKPNRPSEVYFNDQAWLQSNGSTLPLHRRGLAYVTQHAALLPHLNVTENLNYGRQRNRLATAAPDRQPQFARLCRELELEHLQKKYPQQLSGGEQQRVAIGRALLANPQLILLDEPASALDESSRANTLASLERVLKHTRAPCIYVTHNLDELMRLADDVLCLRAGVGEQPINLAQALCDPALPLSQQHGCGVVLQGRLSASDSTTDTAQVTLPGHGVMHCALANANAQAGSNVRLRIYAKDVSIALSKATDSSILNILPATVHSICDYRTGQVLVELGCSGEKILSIITSQSCNQLALQPGSKVYAQIKGIAVLGAGSG